MENSTIQQVLYDFCDDYTNDEVSTYDNIVLQELEVPIQERIDSLKNCDTRFCKDICISESKKDLFSLSRNKNRLNYICDSIDWIGYVIDIQEDTFSAKVIEKDENTTYEIVDFDKKDISTSDLQLLTIGAMFYWSIGYANQGGQVIKQSLIRFKRSIELSIQEFDSIIDEAKKLNDGILWE